jgi:hypothetical protein
VVGKVLDDARLDEQRNAVLLPVDRGAQPRIKRRGKRVQTVGLRVATLRAGHSIPSEAGIAGAGEGLSGIHTGRIDVAIVSPAFPEALVDSLEDNSPTSGTRCKDENETE